MFLIGNKNWMIRKNQLSGWRFVILIPNIFHKIIGSHISTIISKFYQYLHNSFQPWITHYYLWYCVSFCFSKTCFIFRLLFHIRVYCARNLQLMMPYILFLHTFSLITIENCSGCLEITNPRDLEDYQSKI